MGISAAGLLAANTWVYIELQAFIHDTAGYATVRVNGVPVITVTGVDTKGTNETTVGIVLLSGPGTSQNAQFDDLYLHDDLGFQGDPLGPAPPGGDARLARDQRPVPSPSAPRPPAWRRPVSAALTKLGVVDAQVAQIGLRALVALLPEGVFVQHVGWLGVRRLAGENMDGHDVRRRRHRQDMERERLRMSLATAPPGRLDLSMYTNDDRIVAVRWLHVDAVTPIVITSATLTLRFDLPNDDTWARDPITELPIAPARQLHTITSTTPGAAGGWFDASRFALGEALAHISHGLWTTYLQPYRGTWDLVAVSVDDVQRSAGPRRVGHRGEGEPAVTDLITIVDGYIPGTAGPAGPPGAAGAPGAAGPAGPPGAKGDPGSGVTIKGTITAWPPPASSAGDMYLLGTPAPVGAPSSPGGPAAPGDGVVYDGAGWVNVGPIRGPQGPPGATGATGPAGATGATGSAGAAGATGPAGPGVPTGGAAGQVLAKTAAGDYVTGWVDQTGGGGGGITAEDAVDAAAAALAPTLPLTKTYDDTAGTITLAVNDFTTTTRGTVPNPATTSGRFLKDDGTWTLPPSAVSGAGNIFPFTYNTSTAEAITGNQMRGNNATFANSTRLWVSEITVDGLDVAVGLGRIKAGLPGLRAGLHVVVALGAVQRDGERSRQGRVLGDHGHAALVARDDPRRQGGAAVALDGAGEHAVLDDDDGARSDARLERCRGDQLPQRRRRLVGPVHRHDRQPDRCAARMPAWCRPTPTSPISSPRRAPRRRARSSSRRPPRRLPRRTPLEPSRRPGSPTASCPCSAPAPASPGSGPGTRPPTTPSARRTR